MIVWTAVAEWGLEYIFLYPTHLISTIPLGDVLRVERGRAGVGRKSPHLKHTHERRLLVMTPVFGLLVERENNKLSHLIK